MSQGWIKLDRSFIHDELWLSEKFTRAQAWVDMIALANHKPGYIMCNGLRVDLTRGQLGWSEVRLSERWKWSRGKARRFFAELEKGGKIVQQKDSRKNITTIVDYDGLQGADTTNEPETVQQTVQQKDSRQYTNKNVKNEKNTSTTTTREADSIVEPTEEPKTYFVPEASHNDAGEVLTIHDIQGVKDSRNGHSGPPVKPNKVSWYMGEDGLPELQITEQQIRVAQELYNGSNEQLVSELKNFVVDAWGKDLQHDLFNRLRNWITVANRNLATEGKGPSHEENRRSAGNDSKQYWQLSGDAKHERIRRTVEAVQQSGIEDHF